MKKLAFCLCLLFVTTLIGIVGIDVSYAAPDDTAATSQPTTATTTTAPAPTAAPAPSPNPPSSPNPSSTPTPAPAPAPSDSSVTPKSTSPGASGTIKKSGLWIETKLRAQSSMNALTLMGQVTPGIVIGYRQDKIMVGLMADLFAIVQTEEYSGEKDKNRTLGFIISPVFQFSLLTRGPVDLYAMASLGYVHLWQHNKSASGDIDKSQTHGFALNVAAGVRYFLHPSFALGTEVGLSEIWAKTEDDDSEYEDTFSTTTLYGALTAAVIW